MIGWFISISIFGLTTLLLSVLTVLCIPVCVCEISLVKLSDKIFESFFHLLATNLIIIILILGSKIVTKENTRIIKPCHCCWCFWLTCLHLAGTCWLRLSTSVLSKPLLTNPLHNVTIKDFRADSDRFCLGATKMQKYW